MKYNFTRPLLLIVVAFATKMLVTNVLLLLGISEANSENMGFIAMLIAVLIYYKKLRPGNRKK